MRFFLFSFLGFLVFIATGANAASVTRGPYLQMGSDTALTIRWRTDSPTVSFVRYGRSPSRLDQSVKVLRKTTEHEVRLTSLQANSQYYYSVGNFSQTPSGGETGFSFTTSPVPGSSQPTRIWIIGDAGTANASQEAVYHAYMESSGSDSTDIWILLGDNAYRWGSDREYQKAFFDMYPELLRRTPVWPTFGNHDGFSASSDSESGTYYDIFSLPRNAEVGGHASGTEAYYSFDYGDIHFVCLDSHDSNRSPDGPMLTWLKNDLAATNQHWIVAFWHHPPYSKGSHNSDTESQMIKMRENALPILEDYGVDLVFSGHSHSYERSYLIEGHYGSSSKFNPFHQVDSGSGRIDVDGSGAYQKAGDGVVYSVVGSSGKISGGRLNHPAMYTSLNQLGSVVLDIVGNRLDAKFLNSSGSVSDYYTIIKDTGYP